MLRRYVCPVAGRLRWGGSVRLRPGRCRPHGGRRPGTPLDFGFPARRSAGWRFRIVPKIFTERQSGADKFVPFTEDPILPISALSVMVLCSFDGLDR